MQNRTPGIVTLILVLVIIVQIFSALESRASRARITERIAVKYE